MSAGVFSSWHRTGNTRVRRMRWRRVVPRQGAELVEQLLAVVAAVAVLVVVAVVVVLVAVIMVVVVSVVAVGVQMVVVGAVREAIRHHKRALAL